jgi:phosphoglycolate phosphatase-like HAD superfamily hydrolase
LLQITFSPALSREFRPYKLYPTPLLHICSVWEVQPNEVIMVGDSLKDDVSGLFRDNLIEHFMIYDYILARY